MKPRILFCCALLIAAFVTLVGCDNSGQSDAQANRSGAEIVLGASFPLTGDNASYGTDAREGIELALDEINGAGGINGRKTRIIYEDDVVDPKKGVSNMEKLAGVDKVPVVLGSAGSGVTLAMAPIANRTKTVLISPISSAADVTGAGPYVFRTCPSDAAQAEIVAKWMQEKGYKQVGVLFVNNAWGVGLLNAFKKAFTALGGTVVAEEGAEETVTDYRAHLTKLKAANCDALYMPTYSKQGGRILTQAKDLAVHVPLFGGDTWGAQELFDAAGAAADGAYFVVPEKFEGTEYREYAKKYQSKYGKQPDFNASSSYDCMHVVAVALKKVLDAGQSITGETVKGALESSTFNGATGLTKFDENGDVVGKAFGRRVIQGGKAIPAP